MPLPKKMALLKSPSRRSGLAKLSDPRTPLTPLTPSLGTPFASPGSNTAPGPEGGSFEDAMDRGRLGLATSTPPAASRRGGAQREAARTNKKALVYWFQKRFGRISAEVRSNGAIQQAKAGRKSYAAM